MANSTLKIVTGLLFSSFALFSSAQCPVIDCPSDIIADNDSSMCDAIITYSLPTATDTCGPSSSQTFGYTGAQETFTVPAGVTSITVDAYGAQGGSLSPSTNVNYGGHVQADLAVTPGATIYINVGQQATSLVGGWNGGGNGETGGIGGGGASDIRIGGTTLNDRMVVAGGAGGGGFWSNQEVHGGLGGGLVGGTGYRSSITNIGGDPGTQTLSGNGTCVSFNNPICSGGFGFGGAPSGCGCEGYGGGGGWYGGAGSGNCRGGGGGSSYTVATATNVTHNQGVHMGNGEVTISWSVNTTSPTITQIAGLPSGSAFPIGVTTNTFVAENLGGLDTCSFNVTVQDTEIPTIICSGEINYCEGANVNGTAPITADNCPGETVAYTMTGATTGTGINDVDNQTLNTGTTIVTYIVTDAAGNQDSCTFNINVNPLPSVSLAAFSVDSLCDYNPAIALPAGTPATGTYTGAGVSGTNFDPAQATAGTNLIIYTYTDSVGCTNSDTSSIYIDGCASLDEDFFSNEISVYPNPTSGLMTVSYSNFNESFDVSVTTLDGRIIRRKVNSTNSTLNLDLSQEPNGVYLIHIESGEIQRTLKVVKD